jgi:hypothetical protein
MQSDQFCQTVYDLRTAGYSCWSAVGTGAGVTIAICVILWITSRILRRPLQARFWFAPAVAALVTLVAFATTWHDYRQSLDALRSGNIAAIEGPIEDFVPRPITGHSSESFTVRGHHFEYSDFNMTPGFRRSRARGGPFGPGVYVRLKYHGNDILYADVCRSPVD